MSNDFLYNFIRQYKFGVLSTISPDNIPQSAYVGFAVTTDLKIIFDTVSDSRKYKNIILNPNISLVIGWDKEQTVQYEGFAKIPESNELEKLLLTYFEVFPDGKYRRLNLINIAYFCIEPRWIRYSDFSKTTPNIEEMIFKIK